MGLGKTLQTIGLLLCNPPPGKDGKKTYPYVKPIPYRGSPKPPPRCTLIVAPKSVTANWKMELDKFVNRGREIIKIAFYQGSQRELQFVQAMRNDLDVLITSYHTLMADFKVYQKNQRLASKTKATTKGLSKHDVNVNVNVNRWDNKAKPSQSSPSRKKLKREPIGYIFDLCFHRIVLDEAHIIRNEDSIIFQSVFHLQSIHKLCLTGTPYVSVRRPLCFDLRVGALDFCVDSFFCLDI